MNKWADIKSPPIKPVKEKKEEFDWLKEVEDAKRKSKIKTKANEVIYPYIKCIRIKDITESLL